MEDRTIVDRVEIDAFNALGKLTEAAKFELNNYASDIAYCTRDRRMIGRRENELLLTAYLRALEDVNVITENERHALRKHILRLADERARG